jgi:hypothetical protein
MTQHKNKLAVLLILTLLLMFSATAFADGTAPPPPDNTTTYLYYINGYWIAMTPLDYFIATWGYSVCQALLWC